MRGCLIAAAEPLKDTITGNAAVPRGQDLAFVQERDLDRQVCHGLKPVQRGRFAEMLKVLHAHAHAHEQMTHLYR